MAAITITRKRTSEAMKEESQNLLWESDTVKEQEFNVKNIINQWETTDIIKRNEENIKAMRYKAIQGQMLKNRKNMEVLSRSTVYF